LVEKDAQRLQRYVDLFHCTSCCTVFSGGYGRNRSWQSFLARLPLHFSFSERQDATQRNAYPVWPIAQFVAQLVEHLFQTEKLQQFLHVGPCGK
jgi:hypothetical protein